MDDVLYKSLLYDYYAALLTEKQREAFEMYYLNDMSLSEISENTGVSPQAISDLLKRSEKLLLKYEEKLNLVENHGAIRKKLHGAIDEIDGIDPICGKAADSIKCILLEIIDAL